MSNVFDNLAEGLDDQSTDEPILAGGLYTFKIFSIELKENESQTFQWISLSLQLQDEAEDLDGNPLNGCFLNEMIGLTVNEYNSEEDIRREVAKFLDCFQGGRDWDESLESYKGMEGVCKTKVKKERTNKKTGDVYPEQAAVSVYMPK